MDLNYMLRPKTNGANPFKIFEAVKQMDAESVAFGIKRMSYEVFLQSAYWFAISSVAKANAEMRCQICNSGTSLSTHHRTYDRHGYEHSHMIDLVVLCANCHGMFHGQLPAPPAGGKAARLKLGRHFVVPHDPIQMPDGDPIVLNEKLIDECRANGAFTNATLRAFGMTRATMLRGWTGRLEGTLISRENYRKAAEGKFIYRDNPIQ
jgi:hypothetical protein